MGDSGAGDNAGRTSGFGFRLDASVATLAGGFVMTIILILIGVLSFNLVTLCLLAGFGAGSVILSRASTPSKRPAATVKYINFAQLNEVSSGDLSIEEELWSAYQESWDITKSDLELAFAENNAQNARLHSHSLKGACLSIGFDVLAAICKEMEHLSAKGDVVAAGKLLPKLRETHEATSEEMIKHLRELRRKQ